MNTASAPTCSTSRSATSCRACGAASTPSRRAAASAGTRHRPAATVDSGTFQFRDRRGLRPGQRRPPTRSSSTSPSDRRASTATTSTRRDRATTSSLEDKWRVTNNVTLNLGLRYDNQRQTPNADANFAPRAGFAWDVIGTRQARWCAAASASSTPTCRWSIDLALPADRRADAVPEHHDQRRRPIARSSGRT